MSTLKSKIDVLRRAQFTLTVGMAVFAMAFFLAIYRPRQAYLDRISDENIHDRRELAFALTQAARLPQATAEYRRLAVDLSAFQNLPAASDQADLFHQITQISHNASVNEVDLDFAGDVRQTGGLAQVPVHMTFHSDFQSAAEMLCKLEKLQRLTRVQDLEIRGIGAGNDVEVTLHETASTGTVAPLADGISPATQPAIAATTQHSPRRNLFAIDLNAFAPEVATAPPAQTPVAAAPAVPNKPQVIVVVVPQNSTAHATAVPENMSAEQVLQSASPDVREMLRKQLSATQPDASAMPDGPGGR